MHQQRIELYRGRYFLPILILVVLAFTGTSITGCQTNAETSTPRVGILLGLEFFGDVVDTFIEEMETLGYIDGETIHLEVHRMSLDPEGETTVLKKFVEDNVDLIITIPTEATIQAKELTRGTDIPVLFGYASLEGTDLVQNITEPGENLTGVRFPGPDNAVKRLEILLAIKPDVKTILIPYLKDYPNVPHQLKAIQDVAQMQGIHIVAAPASSPEMLSEFIETFQASDQKPVDAIVLIAEPLAVSKNFFDVYGSFAKEQNIPVVGVGVNGAGVETLMGLYPSDRLAGSQLALLAAKILEGESPASIPVLSPDYELYVNLVQARDLNIEIPEELLNKADHILQ